MSYSLLIGFIFGLIPLLILLWMFLPAPSKLIAGLAVVSVEYSLWLGLISLIGVFFSVFSLTRNKIHSFSFISIILSVTALIISLYPIIKSLEIAKTNNDKLSLHQYFFGKKLNNIVPEEIIFAKADNQNLKLDYYSDKSQSLLKKPAIIVIHGGSWSGGDKGGYKEWDNWFVDNGYSVFDIEYRTSPQPNWETSIADVKCAIGWLKIKADKYNIDSSNINLLGRSAGGHLALMAAYTPDNLEIKPSCDVVDTSVKSVISFYGPTDLIWDYKNPSNKFVINSRKTLEDYIGGTLDNKLDIYNNISPVNKVNKSTVPTLMFYGTKDQYVDIENMNRLKVSLDSFEIKNKAVSIPLGQHGFDYNFNSYNSQIAQNVILKFLSK